MVRLRTLALLIESDMDVAEAVSDYLAGEKIDCDHAFDGDAGLEQALKRDCDVILLDVAVPGIGGLDLCRRLRSAGVDLPILMLSDRDAVEDKILGFDAGADDYLVKPFALAELAARVGALRGRRSPQSRLLQVADLTIDLNKRIAMRGRRRLRLSPKAWAILETLAVSSPDIVGRAALERAVWGEDSPHSDSLKFHIHKLRSQLDRPHERPLLQTITRTGFVLRLADS